MREGVREGMRRNGSSLSGRGGRGFTHLSPQERIAALKDQARVRAARAGTALALQERLSAHDRSGVAAHKGWLSKHVQRSDETRAAKKAAAAAAAHPKSAPGVDSRRVLQSEGTTRSAFGRRLADYLWRLR